MKILLDIDGVLNPYVGKQRPNGYVTRYLHNDNTLLPKKKYRQDMRLWLNPDHADWLDSLSGQLVWNTMWGGSLANTVLSSFYGWNNLPAIDVPKISDSNYCGGFGRHRKKCDCLHVKMSNVMDYVVQDKAFVWIDDDIRDVDRTYVRQNFDGYALLVSPNPRLGLTKDMIDIVKDWIIGVNNGH